MEESSTTRTTQEEIMRDENIFAASQNDREYIPSGHAGICRVKFMPTKDTTTPAPRQHEFLNCPPKRQTKPENTPQATEPGAKPVPRPIICPSAGCGLGIILPEFVSHLATEHASIPMKRIRLHTCHSFMLDPQLAKRHASNCVALFLLHKPDIQVACGAYENDLPVMVMMTLVGLTDLQLGQDAEAASGDGCTFLAIWIAGMEPADYPLSVTLSVWKRSGKIPVLNQTLSAPVHDVQHGYWDIYKTGCSLLLSHAQVRALTDEGKHLIEAQLEVH